MPLLTVVEKLRMLRSFVGTSLSESDLSTCLRQSGYQVNVAAERILTGQYQPTKPNTSKTKANNNKWVGGQQERENNSKKRPASTNTRTPAKPETQQNGSSTAKKQKSPPISLSAVTPSPRTSISTNNNNDWLLCSRWISDGVCTVRNGSLGYQEALVIESFGTSLVKFRGRSCGGQLPKHLNEFLARLLPLNIIQVKASALMEERGLPVGSHVALALEYVVYSPCDSFVLVLFIHFVHILITHPLLLMYQNRIWLPDPKAFFSVFDEISSSQAATSSKMFFGTTKSKTNEHVVAKAAFDLLQWAQYGDSYDFEQPIQIQEDEEDNNNENEEELLLLEDDKDASVQEEEHLEMNQKFQTTTSQFPEMEAPKDFRCELRLYQKQALWWMIQRESLTENEEATKQQLQVLQELSASTAATTTSSASIPTNVPIHCDCGPVCVQETIGAFVETIAPAIVDNGTSAYLNHPLWERRYLCNSDRTQALSFYVQPLFGMAVPSPPSPPQPCRGGILADSMGLGKTIMLLALIQATKNEEGKATTLIVAPLSLLSQWEEEIQSKTNLSYSVYYGDEKKRVNNFSAVNIVLTTYGVLQSDLQSKKQTGLLSHSWKRAILDEAHTIKNTATVGSRASCLLKAERRWCVSGTIIQNSLEDVYALLKFLKHEPWCSHAFWKAAITREEDANLAMERVRNVLKPILIRRTKESVDKDGNPILQLPPKEIKTIMVEFSPAERQFYDALYRKSLTLFEGFIKTGRANKSYLAIFSLLQRLRQTCDHVALTVKAHLDPEEWGASITSKNTEVAKVETSSQKEGDSIDAKFLDDLMKKFQTMQRGTKEQSNGQSYANKIAQMLNDAYTSGSQLEECAICLDPINIHKSVVTPCFHIFCKECLVDVLKASNKQSKLSCPNGPCPVCTEEIDSSKILCINEFHDGKVQTSYLLDPVKPPKEVIEIDEEDEAARQVLETAISGSSSSKINAIMTELDNIWQQDPGSKVLIFSQFLGFLDLMEQSFSKSRIPFSRLDGRLSLQERTKVLRAFGKSKKSNIGGTGNKTGSVLLISMKTGGVGLNLTAASTCFIADPWWNGAVEDQCVDRIHRIGQMAEKVRVRKFYVADSVEERIVELQERKKSVASKILSEGNTGMGDSSIARPTLDDFKVLFRSGRFNGS